MTEKDIRDKERRAEQQRERRKQRYEESSILDGVFSGVTKMAIGAAAGIGTVALANRTGIAPVLEQGLTFGSRLLNRAATYSSNKAIEDWTIRDFRRLSSGMKNAFQEAKDSLGTFYIDPHDNRTLFGTVSSIQSLMGDGSKAMSRQLFRQEKVINPTIDWYRQHNVSKRFDENTNKRIENFIRAIASAPRDKNELYSAQKALGAYEDRNLRRTTDALIRKVQELDKDLVAKTKYRRRTNVGIRNIVDVALDIEKLEKEFGTIRKKPSAFEQLLRGEKDRAVTIRDLLRHNGMAKGIAYHTAKDGQDLRRDPIQELREIAEYGRTRFKENPDWYERFMDLTPDAAGLRIAGNGLIYSTEGRRQFTDSLLSAAANTLPGKILKMRDVSYSRVAPKVFRWAKGVSDPVLASLTNEEKNKKSSQVDSTLIRVYDNYYRMSSRGVLEDLGDLGGTHLYSGKFGATQHLIKQMSGDIRYKQSDNAILRKLDLFQDRDEYSGKGPTKFIKSLVDKYDDPNYIGNIIDDLSSDTMSQAIIDAEKLGRVDFALDYVNRAKALHSFMKETTIEFDRDTARALSGAASGPSEDILEALATKTPKELEDYLLSLKPDDIINKPLSDLANKLRTNREELIQTIETGYGRDRKNLGSSLLNVIGTGIGKEASTYEDTIRKELSKEALLRSGLDESSGAMNYDDILNLVNSASLTTRQRTEVRRLAHLATFEDKTLKRSPGVSGDGNLSDKELFDQVYDINVALSNNEIRETLQLSKKEHLNWQTTHYSDIDEIGNPAEYNTWSTIRNSETPLDVLSSLNDWSKLKASISRFGGQFAAGRDNMGEVSEMTLAPYFMLSRLSDEMNILGVGFSKDSMGSTFDMMKSIALKRILPVAVGSTYLEWLDDTSEEVTGISIAGAAAQGIANVDLAARKTLDFIGMTDWLKGEKALNPIMQYWGDHTEFMSYDERKEWYESGYEPVRKGAWWTFGGVNEARGAEISYWQPSFVRRIQSDYLDKSLYDGYFDKWSHSLLPTPANPLSPFIGLADPYWLEEKHKDDRPYMLTGEMFASGTPWGAILNPTVGALLKPQKSLHEIPILGFNYRNINGVDPMSLMHAINMEIKQKARDLAHMNYVKVDGDQFTPVNISEYENYAGERSEEHATYKNGTAVEKTEGFGTKKEPTQEEITAEDVRAAKETNINIASPGEIIDYKLTGAKNPFETPGAIYNDGDGVKIVPTAEKLAEQRHEARELKLEDELEIEKLLYGDEDGIRSAIVGLIKKYNPIKTIGELNEGVKEKAKKKRSAGTSDEYESEDGIVQAQKLKHFKPSNSMELLNDADTVSEMVNAGKGSDMVRDAAISWRLVSGIYGYAFGAATGFGVDDKKVIATGADMTSFSRTFWDSNVGGAGGGVMEIARRFIPDFRRGTRINPLMNEMPDWIPERLKTGDPYALVPKGEMRLPGKGYEALNELHPDQYGYYGAFDRMKILADVAPFSPEYRLWRDIAKKTVTDPELIEEMEEIRERVNQQGKKHDFYDYKVVGRGLEYKNVVVSDILDYGKFKSGNTTYKIAGASIRANEAETMKDVLGRYIHVGQEITIAVDEDEYSGKNKDTVGSVNAAVFIEGQNIGLEMIEQGDATVRKGDTSSAALLANYGPVQKGIAYMSELFAHADVPWLSDQFLRVRSPIESYKAEQVYGTPYQSWEHPISSFLMPAVERAVHDRSAFTPLIGTAARAIDDIPGLTPGMNHFTKAAWLLNDRGAFIGFALANLVNPGNKMAMQWARHGSAIATAGHFLTGGNSYFDEITSGGQIGYEVGRLLEKNRGKAAAIGATIGMAYRTLFGDESDWIPDRTKEKWEMQDYFDRLTYIKYMGLYRRAAELAEEEEGVDVEDLLERREKLAFENSKAIDKFKRLKKKLRRKEFYGEPSEEMVDVLNEKIEYLENDNMAMVLGDLSGIMSFFDRKIRTLDRENTMVEVGEWTRTALLYKQAADSTMYGLKDNSSWSQIVTALPTNDREYFMEFVKVTNPERREEILRYASPALKRALALAWGKKPEKQESNEDFFKKHELPKANWAGWAPQYDLKDIEVKTIENEGMMLADFGYYDSQLRDPKVQDAPTTNYSGTDEEHNELAVKKNLQKILYGSGLKDVDISVQPGPSGGVTSIIAIVKTMLGFGETQERVNESLSMQASM